MGPSVSTIPPADVSQDVTGSDTVAHLFEEKQNYVLSQDIGVNVLMDNYTDPLPAVFENAWDESMDLYGFIPQGTEVSSHYLFMDQQEWNFQIGHAEGSVTFDGQILGVISNEVFLCNFPGNEWEISAAELGLPSVTYGPVNFQGMDYIFPSDSWSIGPDGRTLNFEFNVTTGQDNLRVITAAAPEPATATLLVLGAVTALRRRK